LYLHFLKRSFIYAFIPQIPKFANFLLLPFINQHLSPDDYGIYGLIVAYTIFTEAFRYLGLEDTLASYYFNYPARYKFIWNKIYAFLYGWSFVFAILQSLAIYLALPDAENLWYVILLIALPAILLEPTSLLGRFILQYQSRLSQISYISLISSLISIAATYISIVYFSLGYIGFFIGIFCAKVFSFIPYLRHTHQANVFPDFKFSWHWIIKKIAISLPATIYLYKAYINAFDKLLLEFHQVSLHEIGLYFFASGISLYFWFFVKNIKEITIPIYRRTTLQSENLNHIDYQFTNFIEIILLLLAFLIVLWAKEVVDYLSGGTLLKESYRVVAPLVFAYLYYPIYHHANILMSNKQNTKKMALVFIMASLFNILACFILIPLYSIAGAAYALLISYVLVYIAISQIKQYRYDFYDKKVILLALTVFIAANIWIDASLYWKVPVTIITSACGILYTYRKIPLIKVIVPYAYNHQ
jgi:O-antigen/teichoic acid export membrane protein